MLHLIKYDIIAKLRNFNVVFWPLVFPLVLGTFFYFAFGNIEISDFETIKTAVVKEGNSPDETFLKYLDGMEKTDNEENQPLIKQTMMTRSKAVKALEDKKVSGIYFVGEDTSLTVGKTGMEESILQSMLESYQNGKQTLEDVAKNHPEGMAAAVKQLSDYKELVRQVSLGGKSLNSMSQLFYTLISMACLYGCFIGFGAAISIKANLTPLAARKCVTPTHRIKMILSEMLTSFGLHFINLLILLLYLKYILRLEFEGNMPKMLLTMFVGGMIGVSMGIFVGSIGKLGEGAKIGILLAVSMVCSTMAGLMSNTTKYMIEQACPLVNRLNPAALISDAFYCINVYDDPARLFRNLITLTVMCVVLLFMSFLSVRRDRYDSI